MDRNFDEKTIAKAKALANSPEGQQLQSALSQTHPEIMAKAQAQLSAGDYAQLMKTLAPLMASEDFKKVLRQLGR